MQVITSPVSPGHGLGLIYPEATAQIMGAELGVITNEITDELGIPLLDASGLRQADVDPSLRTVGTAGIVMGILWSLVTTAAIGASAYHGYKRHDSVGAAIGWGILGGLFPIITVPVAFAQGFGQRKGR